MKYIHDVFLLRKCAHVQPKYPTLNCSHFLLIRVAFCLNIINASVKCRCLTVTHCLSFSPPFSTLASCLSPDLNSLLPMADLEDFLSPLPEPSASGTVISCEFPKPPSSTVRFLIHSACRIYIPGGGTCYKLYLPADQKLFIHSALCSVHIPGG